MKRLLFALLGALAFATPALADTPWTLVKSYPHDSAAFTEGLFFMTGRFMKAPGWRGGRTFARCG